MGYDDLIAKDAKHYVQLALALWHGQGRSRTASGAILKRCDPLFDDRKIVRELENFWHGLSNR